MISYRLVESLGLKTHKLADMGFRNLYLSTLDSRSSKITDFVALRVSYKGLKRDI